MDTNQAGLQCKCSVVRKTEVLITECLDIGKINNEETVGYFF